MVIENILEGDELRTDLKAVEAKVQELERLQNTTHGPIHLQNIQNPYKRGCIGPFDFVVKTQPVWPFIGIMGKGNSYYLAPFCTI